jgi:hypothetical protein
MTAASVVDLTPALKEAAARPADRAVSTFDLSLRPKLPTRPAARVEAAYLPDLEAGQVWVIEISPMDELSPLHRDIISDGNVIIYDRSLEAIVAKALPLGGYAEPESSAKTIQRCIQFARDGWSVVRLVDPQAPAAHRNKQLQELSLRWQMATAKNEPSVFVSVAKVENGRRVTTPVEIDQELAAAIGEGNLTVVFSAIGTAVVPTFASTPENGLAG